MAIKMRILYSSSKKKMNNIAEAIKAKYELAFNAVDVIPPAYSCDKERVVVLIVSAKGNVSDSVRLFCRELTKARAQNVALMIHGDEAAANNLKEILTKKVDIEHAYKEGDYKYLKSLKPTEVEYGLVVCDCKQLAGNHHRCKKETEECVSSLELKTCECKRRENGDDKRKNGGNYTYVKSIHKQSTKKKVLVHKYFKIVF